MKTTSSTKTKMIPADVAGRISRRLVATLGQPEGGAFSLMDVWHTDATWRFRRDDGSAWARIGFGPTRKMVTLSRQSNRAEVRLTVYNVAA